MSFRLPISIASFATFVLIRTRPAVDHAHQREGRGGAIGSPRGLMLSADIGGIAIQLGK